MEEPLPAASKNTSYEDLRSQNREDYDKKRQQPNHRFVLTCLVPHKKVFLTISRATVLIDQWLVEIKTRNEVTKHFLGTSVN